MNFRFGSLQKSKLIWLIQVWLGLRTKISGILSFFWGERYFLTYLCTYRININNFGKILVPIISFNYHQHLVNISRYEHGIEKIMKRLIRAHGDSNSCHFRSSFNTLSTTLLMTLLYTKPTLSLPFISCAFWDGIERLMERIQDPIFKWFFL